MDKWTPAKEGSGFEFTEILKPLEKYRDHLVVVSNLAHPQAAGIGSDAGADHARSAAVFLSGAHPEKAAIHVGITIDQIVAQKIGQDTPLPSLELSIEEVGLNCGSGYACAYTNTISWKTPTLPLPMENNPQVVFEKLFGDGSTPEERLARKQQSRSLLDSVTSEVASLQAAIASVRPRPPGRVSRRRSRDRAPHSESRGTDAQRFEAARSSGGHSGSLRRSLQDHVRSAGARVPGEDHARRDHDVRARHQRRRLPAERRARRLPRRVASFQRSRQHGSVRADQQVSREDAGYFLDKLKATPDGDGTLLDHSMVLYGSSMSNGNQHDHDPLPVVVAGGASGQLKGGRHIVTPPHTPMSNLLLAMLDKLGVEQDSFGDSTGKVEI